MIKANININGPILGLRYTGNIKCILFSTICAFLLWIILLNIGIVTQSKMTETQKQRSIQRGIFKASIHYLEDRKELPMSIDDFFQAREQPGWNGPYLKQADYDLISEYQLVFFNGILYPFIPGVCQQK